jgi:hypothetical protein
MSFNQLPPSYRNGVAVYKQQNVGRLKWEINFDLPTFSLNQNFIQNIIGNYVELENST